MGRPKKMNEELEKETNKSEELDKEVNKEKLVSVSMTEEEKEEFVKFKASQKKTEEKKEPEAMVEITLNHVHNINGQAYYPGKHRVGEVIGQYLVHRDGIAKRAHTSVQEGNIYRIMPDNSVRKLG